MKLRTGLKALIGISVLGIAVAIFLIYTCPFAGQIAFSTLVRQVPMEHGAGPTGHSEEHSGEAEKPHVKAEEHMESQEERHEGVKAHPEAVQKPHGAVAEHHESAGEYPQPLGAEMQKPHGGVEKHEEHKEGKEEGHQEVKAHPEAAQKPHEAVAEGHKESEGLKVHLMVIPNVQSYPVKETKLFGFNVSLLGIIVLLLLIALCFFVLRQRPLNFLGYSVTPKAMGVTVFLIALWNLVFAAFLLGVEVVHLKELWLTWLTFDATVVASVIVAVLSFNKQVVPLRFKSFENLDE